MTQRGDEGHDGRIDPFADSIVTEPRHIERSVPALNDAALQRLLAAFNRIARHPPPRLSPPAAVELVTSVEPGYGKSHLVGRLFKRLDDEATLIYLRPFQDSATCWVSLLSKIIAELDSPDDSEKLKAEAGEVTQLDVLARRVLVNLVQKLLAKGSVKRTEPSEDLRFFERYPNAVFETPEWRAWIHENKSRITQLLDAELRVLDIRLRPNNVAWLSVLFAYAFGEEDRERRQIALDWLACSPLDAEEGRQIGLRLADLAAGDSTPEGRNEAAFERIRDLFKVAAFYRPFLLCFDQTEVYDQSPELARSLGVVLSRLRRETVNHLCVVTGNQFVWDKKVVERFEQADRDCLSPTPIRLVGMTRDQAQALLAQRLLQFRISESEAAAFVAGGWLGDLFELRATCSVRQVLRRASKEWGTYREPDVGSVFESYHRRLLADPKRLEYDPGVFQWTLEHVLGPAVQMEVQRFESPRGYLTLRWRNHSTEALFGFEPGQAWKRWEAIFNEGSRFHQQGAHEGRDTKVRFFRTPLQRQLPERNQRQIGDSADGFFRVVHLERDEAAMLYAAHDLHADVLQSNQSFSTEEVIACLRTRLKDFAERVLEGKAPSSRHPETLPVRDDLPARLKSIVQTAKLVTLSALMERLQPAFAVNETAVLEACSKLPSVSVFSSPQCTVVQWIQSP